MCCWISVVVILCIDKLMHMYDESMWGDGIDQTHQHGNRRWNGRRNGRQNGIDFPPSPSITSTLSPSLPPLYSYCHNLPHSLQLISSPHLMSLTWEFFGTPPYTTVFFTSLDAPYLSHSCLICSASSLVGASIRTIGPSPGCKYGCICVRDWLMQMQTVCHITNSNSRISFDVKQCELWEINIEVID